MSTQHDPSTWQRRSLRRWWNLLPAAVWHQSLIRKTVGSNTTKNQEKENHKKKNRKMQNE